MKERTNILSYKQKGELIASANKVIETVKKEEHDFTNLDKFIEDVEKFCAENMNKTIDVNFTIKCVE
jgi:predicted esterase YcpF (UPF0227 family)